MSHPVTRRTALCLLGLIACTTLHAAGISVAVLIEVEGYTRVEDAYKVTVFDDGETVTTIAEAHRIVTVGGEHDGQVTAVSETTSVVRTNSGTPSSSSHVVPERIVETVAAHMEVQTIIVPYASDVEPSALVEYDDLSLPAPQIASPAAVDDAAFAIVTDSQDAVAQAMGSLLAPYLPIELDAATQESDAALAGDPVSVATGALVFEVCDATLNAGAVSLELSRTHRTGGPSGLYGRGWWSLLDTHLVFGTSPGVAEAIARVEQALAALTDGTNGALAVLTADASRALNDRNVAIAILRSYAAPAFELAHALSLVTYHGEGWEEVMEIVDTEMTRALRIAGEISYHADALEDEKEAIAVAVDAAVDTIERAVADMTAALRDLERTQAWSASNARRNAGFGKPQAQESELGVESVTLTDANGYPRRFTVVDPPSAGGATYANGEPDYYPSGSDLENALPGTARLRLEPDGTFTLRRADASVWRFGFHGELRGVEDANGNGFEVRYDESGPIRIDDSRGRSISIERDASGRISRLRLPDDATIVFSRDEGGRLASVTDEVGVITWYEYGDGDVALLSRVVHADGSARSYHYAYLLGRTRVVSVVDEIGAVERFAYDPGRTKWTNASGLVTAWRFNADLQTTLIEYPGGATESFEYDANGRLVARLDRGGNRTSLERDAVGRIVGMIHADGSRESFAYDSDGRVTAHTQRDGQTIRYAFDHHGNLASVDYPDGTSERYEYVPPGSPSAGSVARHVDRIGNHFEFAYGPRGYVASVRDSVGLVATFEHDIMGRITRSSDGEGNPTDVRYRLDNLVASVTDPLGARTEFQYDLRKDLVAKTLAGAGTEYRYSPRRELVEMISALDERVRFEYRADGLAVASEVLSAPTRAGVSAGERSASRVEYQYDEGGRTSQRTQIATGAIVRYEYDETGRVRSVIEPDGVRSDFTWSADGLLTLRERSHDGSGGVERYAYTGSGELLAYDDPTGARWTRAIEPQTHRTTLRDPLGVVAWVEMTDPYGRIVSERDGMGVETTYKRDERGRPLAVERSGITLAAYSYDLADRVVSFTDGEGSTWRFARDRAGHVRTVTNPDGTARSYEYDARGFVVAEHDETGLITRYEYDAAGRLRARIDPPGSAYAPRTEYEWHYLGSLAAVTDATGRTWRTIYDDAGRAVASIEPDGSRTTYDLDVCGRVLSEIDPTGRRATYAYDELGRCVETSRGEEVTRYAYDAADRVVRMSDALGRTSTCSYDGRGNLVESIDYAGSVTRTAYDRASRPVHVELPAADVAIGYDTLGRVARRTWSGGEFDAYTWDRADRLVVAENEVERLDFSYDSAGRVTRTIGSATGTNVEYSYDAAGRRVARFDRTGGIATSYGYDDAGRLSRVADDAAGVFAIEHDATGRTTSIHYPNSLTSRSTYDANGRISSTSVSVGATLLDGVATVRDAAGRSLFDVDADGSVTAYEYDDAGRLARVVYPLTESIVRSAYDRAARSGLVPALDNDASPIMPRTQTDGTPFAGVLPLSAAESEAVTAAYRLLYPLRRTGSTAQQAWCEEFDYNASGDLTAWRSGWGEVRYTYNDKGRLAGYGDATYDYDVAGNLIRETLGDSACTFEYTPRGRIASAVTASATVRYSYDALGRRVERVESRVDDPLRLSRGSTDAPERTVYRYDALSYERVSTVVGITTATLARSTVPAQSRYRSPAIAGALPAGGSTFSEVSADGHTLAVTGGDGTLALFHDARGSVRYASTALGNGRRAYRYTAYGDAIDGVPAGGSTYAFAGKPLDSVTGHADFGRRDYDSALGRFTTIDPVREGSNWYAYCHGDPVNYVDAFGLSPAVDTGGRPESPLKQNCDELSGIPYMAAGGCNFRAYQFVAEDYLGMNLTSDEIAASVTALQSTVSLADPNLMVLDEDLRVNNPDQVMNDAFERLGRPDLTGTAGYGSGEVRYYVRRGDTPNLNRHSRVFSTTFELLFDPHTPEIEITNIDPVEVRIVAPDNQTTR